jgi:putative intracellular protease/amidase
VQLFTDAASVNFKDTKEQLWQETATLETFVGKAAEYEAILYVGGFGPMFDLVDNAISQQIIREFWEAGKIVSAVCHGAAALLKAKLANGDLLIKGHRVTGFSNEEEIAVDRQKDMPFHLETALNVASNGFYEKAPVAWGPKAIVTANGRLLTGQNPASAGPLAEEILRVLQGAAPYTL